MSSSTERRIDGRTKPAVQLASFGPYLLHGAQDGITAISGGEGLLILIGTSHMCCTAEFLLDDTVVLAYLGFCPERTAVAGVLRQSDELMVQDIDCVVLDLLSNLAFIGANTEGLPAATVRLTDGRYHIVRYHIVRLLAATLP
jgi:hypothetical protein